MYSGSDSTESQNYTQWAMNPSSAFQNVPGEQVDWAALAQQWIIMKEAGPPPLQHQQPSAQLKKEPQNEGGEAPMDVESEREEESNSQWTNINVPPPGDSWTWNAQRQQWGWTGGGWNAPPAVPPPSSVSGPKAPLLPTPSSGYSAQFPGSPEVGEPPNYSGGYWPGPNSKLKPHNKRFSKVNPLRPSVVPEPVTLDAAKRKQLPAWIREGLEKMERDKQKQLEREREKQENNAHSDKVLLSEKDTLEIINSTVKEQKSKYESDESDHENEDTSGSELRGKTLTPEPAPLTQEELMLKVRRTMTEILLNVTNKEIQQICKEELQRYINKNKASDEHLSAPSGSNISAKLGLGMYGGDSGSSSEDSEDEKQERKDSDSELREIIKRKKAEFSKVEREIEEKLADADKTGNEDSTSVQPEANDNDSQVDAKFQGRKPRRSSSAERTPPLKQQPRHSRTSSSSSDRNRSTRRSRRSSSSESVSSDRRRGKSRRKDRRSRSRSRRRTRSRSRSRQRRRSRSRDRRRSRSYRRRSRSRRRSNSSTRKYHRRRSRSSSEGRGKRSRRR